MLIIRQQGRLGNQMFQYALYRSLEEKGKEVFLDCDHHVNLQERNGLDIFPNITYKVAQISDSEKLGNCKWTIFNRILRKIGKTTKKSHYKEKYDDTIEVLKNLEDYYLDGFWQNEKFFYDIRRQLLSEFIFPEIESQQNRDIKAKIEACNSVSVHIRRGDYVSDKYMKKYGSVCNEQYYAKAVEYMLSRVKDAEFFVFTDDYEWVVSNMTFPHRTTFVSSNEGNKAYVDMQLMSCCKHNIIANSSFSWWGAWLNTYENKIVVSPSVWTNVDNNDKIICESWIRI